MKTRITLGILAMLAIVGCRHLPPEVEESTIFQAWIKEIEDAKSVFPHIRAAGYNNAVLVGTVAGIELHDTNTVIANCLHLSDVKTIKAEFAFHKQQVDLLFSSDAGFGQHVPVTGEVWVVHGRANASGIWFVDGGLLVAPRGQVLDK
jgi:hypothetical protein